MRRLLLLLALLAAPAYAQELGTVSSIGASQEPALGAACPATYTGIIITRETGRAAACISSVWATASGVYSVVGYGAKCDGVTNDAVAIQAAIDAATTAGGTVIFPDSDCETTAALELKSNVRLLGSGPSSKLSTTSTAINLVFGNTVLDAAVEHLFLEGGSKNQTDDGNDGGNGIDLRLSSSNILINHCRLEKFDDAIFLAESDEITVTENYFTEVAGAGVRTLAVTDSVLSDNIMEGTRTVGDAQNAVNMFWLSSVGTPAVSSNRLTVSDNTGSNFSFEALTGAPRYSSITGNVFDTGLTGIELHSNSDEVAQPVIGGSFNAVSGNTIRNMTTGGIILTESVANGLAPHNVSIEGNVIDQNGVGSGILLQNDSLNNKISENKIANSASHGIALGLTAKSNLLRDNYLQNCGNTNVLHGILVQGGDGNEVSGNYIVDSGANGIRLTGTPSNTAIKGNTVVDSGDAGTITVGISIAGGTDTYVTGNKCWDAGGATQTRGLSVAVAATGTVISINDFRNNTLAAGISNSDTTAIIFGNVDDAAGSAFLTTGVDIISADELLVGTGAGDGLYKKISDLPDQIQVGGDWFIMEQASSGTLFRELASNIIPAAHLLGGGNHVVDTSANVASKITDENGTGAFVMNSAISGFVNAPFVVADGGTGTTSLTADSYWSVDGIGAIEFTAKVTGALVGSTQAQTLTNKTINTASNTITVEEADISDGPFVNTTGDAMTGPLDITHTAAFADDHAMEINTDAAGFGDVKALDIVYETGAISTGDDEAVIFVGINELDATGGEVFGMEVLSTEGSADAIYGLKAGAVVGPVLQDSGSFANPTTGTNNTTSTDVPAMIDGSEGTNTTIFVADNDYILIGAAAAFTEIEFDIETPAANPGIQPTFGYSTTGAHQFTTFSPVDGTNGFRNTGVVAWDAGDLTGHVANSDTSTFDIKITRTHASAGSVSLFFAKTAATVEYSWDKDGNVSVNDLETASGVIDSSVATAATAFILDAVNGSHSGGFLDMQDGGVSKLNIDSDWNLTQPNINHGPFAGIFQGGHIPATYPAGDPIQPQNVFHHSYNGTLTAAKSYSIFYIPFDLKHSNSIGNSDVVGLNIVGKYLNSNTSQIRDVIGVSSFLQEATFGGGTTVNAYRALKGTVSLTQATAATLGTLVAFEAQIQTSTGQNKTVTNAIPVDVKGPGGAKGTGTTFANWFGLRIQDQRCDQTNATTCDALLIDSQTADGSVGTDLNLRFAGGAWNTGHLVIGDFHMWTDGTDLFYKDGAPTDATDGIALPRSGAAPPATCNPGTIFIDTDETDDTNCTTTNDNSQCLCTAADTWTAMENN